MKENKRYIFLHFLPLMSPGPCPPTNVSVSTLCGVSTVSWSPATGADMYIATATTLDGHNYTCDSSNASSCSFTDLACGENYSVTVVAVDRGCHSKPSSAVDLKTGEKIDVHKRHRNSDSYVLGHFLFGSQRNSIERLKIWMY